MAYGKAPLSLSVRAMAALVMTPFSSTPQTGLSAAAMFEQKKTCSHRAQALAKLMQYFAAQVAQ